MEKMKKPVYLLVITLALLLVAKLFFFKNESIEPYSQTQSLKNIGDSMSESSKIYALTDVLWEKYNDKGIGALNPYEQILLHASIIEAEINNGGFDQYFINSSGDFAQDTVASLKKIGAQKTADLLQSANAQFGPSGPPKDRKARLDLIESMEESGSDYQDYFEDLDTQFYKYEDDLSQLMYDFFQKHRSEFDLTGVDI